MDKHVKEFYRQFSEEHPDGGFHYVLALHEAPDVQWEAICAEFPMLCKGWYELTLLTTQDRIEFVRDHWLSKLAYHPGVNEFIAKFFDSLDDIGIYVFQRKFEDPYEVNLVYSLKGDIGFFRGAPAASDDEIDEMRASFPDCLFPKDYLSFLRIHNGFWKTTDTTGLIKVEHLAESYNQFQAMFSFGDNVLTTTKGVAIDPKRLIPFYESFGMPFYQCFWSEWYHEQEMGNVYFAGDSFTICDAFNIEPGSSSMAFPTFVDWLMFYLERVE